MRLRPRAAPQASGQARRHQVFVLPSFRKTMRAPAFGSADRKAQRMARLARRRRGRAKCGTLRNKADFRRVQARMAKYSREQTDGLEVALAIHLGIYCA